WEPGARLPRGPATVQRSQVPARARKAAPRAPRLHKLPRTRLHRRQAVTWAMERPAGSAGCQRTAVGNAAGPWAAEACRRARAALAPPYQAEVQARGEH